MALRSKSRSILLAQAHEAQGVHDGKSDAQDHLRRDLRWETHAFCSSSGLLLHGCSGLGFRLGLWVSKFLVGQQGSGSLKSARYTKPSTFLDTRFN